MCKMIHIYFILKCLILTIPGEVKIIQLQFSPFHFYPYAFNGTVGKRVGFTREVVFLRKNHFLVLSIEM